MAKWEAARRLCPDDFIGNRARFGVHSRETMPLATEPDRRGLTLLGRSEAARPAEPSAATLETFQNRFTKRDYTIRFDCEDFTSLCPITGQPDFASLRIE